jgi:hypothetical protein
MEQGFNEMNDSQKGHRHELIQILNHYMFLIYQTVQPHLEVDWKRLVKSTAHIWHPKDIVTWRPLQLGGIYGIIFDCLCHVERFSKIQVSLKICHMAGWRKHLML